MFAWFNQELHCYWGNPLSLTPGCQQQSKEADVEHPGKKEFKLVEKKLKLFSAVIKF